MNSVVRHPSYFKLGTTVPKQNQTKESLLSSRSTMTLSKDTDKLRMVCTECGLLQETSKGNYCKYGYHSTKWNKRKRTLVMNDQSEFDELDAGTYKVDRQNDGELLTVQDGAHRLECICTKCMCKPEVESFDSPYNQKWMIVNVQQELRKFIETDGMEGLNLYDAQRLERRITRARISNPEIKVGEKLVEDTLENGKKVYFQPIVSQKSVESWMHWLPVVATKENLDSFNPTLMKSMSKMGVINRNDFWAVENWETFPWCESVSPKRMWNMICCDCKECGGCDHEFCKETLHDHRFGRKIDYSKCPIPDSYKRFNENTLPYPNVSLGKHDLDIEENEYNQIPFVFLSDNPESLAKNRFNRAKHVLFTTRMVPEGHHIEWDSWKGTSFVKDEVVKVQPQKTLVSDYQRNTLRANGIECPTWYNYQDAYKVMGMIFKKQITQAKELVESARKTHEHMKLHVQPYDNKYCHECSAWYIHKEIDETPLGKEVPAHDIIIYEDPFDYSKWYNASDGTIQKIQRTSGTLCDPATGKLAFDEDGELTNKRYNIGIVGVSRIPEWRVPFFKREVEKILNDSIEKYGITHLTIVSGGAEGVDTLVEEMCKARGIDFVVYPPEADGWHDEGTKKGFKTRNLEIIAKATCKIYNLVGATKEPNCYHCTSRVLVCKKCPCGMKYEQKASHWRSGGCWTMNQAIEKGTSTEMIEVA